MGSTTPGDQIVTALVSIITALTSAVTAASRRYAAISPEPFKDIWR
jgi:hypothetical protein